MRHPAPCASELASELIGRPRLLKGALARCARLASGVLHDLPPLALASGRDRRPDEGTDQQERKRDPTNHHNDARALTYDPHG